jgi:hypothetical protein
MQQAIERGECAKRADSLVCLPGSTPQFWQSVPLNTYPVVFPTTGVVLAGPEMTSEIGVPNRAGFNASLVPKDPRNAGWLSWGPSLPLPIGKYKFTLSYISNEKPTLPVGKWDVVLQQGGAGNEKSLFSGKLMGTSGATMQLDGVITIAPGQETMPLEIRTFYLAQGDLQLVGASLLKLP